jgi:hypothetical protein
MRFLEGHYAPTERRLRHVAFVRRAREVADRRQRQEVIEPGEVHERCFVGIKTKKNSIGQQPRQWRSFTKINPQTEYSVKIVEIREKTTPSPARSAIEAVVADKANHCPDLGGRTTTRKVTDAVIAA